MKHLIPSVLSVLALMTGCASSPQPQYYTLSSVSGNVIPAAKMLTVKVRRPVIPQTLDRPEMVSLSSDNTIKENENRLWSEPLDRMTERVLAEDLRQRIPRSLIVTESSGVPVKDAVVLDIEIQQFGADAGGIAVLQAQAVIRRPDGREASLPVALRGSHVESPESMAAALSILMGKLADSAAYSLSR